MKSQEKQHALGCRGATRTCRWWSWSLLTLLRWTRRRALCLPLRKFEKERWLVLKLVFPLLRSRQKGVWQIQVTGCCDWLLVS